MFVGVGAARVRDMFETAKKNEPCIISLHTPASPVTTVRPSATANATRKNAAQI